MQFIILKFCIKTHSIDPKDFQSVVNIFLLTQVLMTLIKYVFTPYENSEVVLDMFLPDLTPFCIYLYQYQY